MNTLYKLNGTYNIDPTHSRLGFVARHAMVTKVRGSIDEFSGSATTEENLSNAQIRVEAKMDSIDTRNADRDGHLKSADFFDVENYPQLTFVSTSITAADENTMNIVGDLTIRGTTQKVNVLFDYTGEATDPFGNHRVGFEGTTEINRKDFGLNFNAALETGGVLVSDKIVLEFELSLIKE